MRQQKQQGQGSESDKADSLLLYCDTGVIFVSEQYLQEVWEISKR